MLPSFSGVHGRFVGRPSDVSGRSSFSYPSRSLYASDRFVCGRTYGDTFSDSPPPTHQGRLDDNYYFVVNVLSHRACVRWLHARSSVEQIETIENAARVVRRIPIRRMRAFTHRRTIPLIIIALRQIRRFSKFFGNSPSTFVSQLGGGGRTRSLDVYKSSETRRYQYGRTRNTSCVQ